MKLSTVQTRLVTWYLSGLSYYIKSAPGRGKTETLVSAAALLSDKLKKNIGVVVINGPLLTPADAVGYLVPKHSDGYSESVYTSPFWWRTREGKRLEEYDGGIIVVDEADKMDTDVKKVIGEAALSGRLGPHVLPDGWRVWMAGNRTSDRSGSTKELDHLINRRVEIDISDDIASWLEWASKHNVSPLTQAFAAQNPQIVFTDGVPEKQGPWCTPRSLVAADRHMQLMNFSDDIDTMVELTGMVGQGAAAQLSNFMRLEREMPKFEEILKNPTTVRVPEKPDAQMLICYNLAHRVEPENADAVLAYVSRMPKEFEVSFLKAACGRNYRLPEAPAIAKWVSKNAQLMAIISARN